MGIGFLYMQIMQFFLHLVKRFEDSHLETWFLNAAIFYLPLAYIFGG